MKNVTDKLFETAFNDPKLLLWEHCNRVWFEYPGYLTYVDRLSFEIDVNANFTICRV